MTEHTTITEVVPTHVTMTLYSTDDVIPPISLHCRAVSDPLTYISVTWHLTDFYRDTERCSAFRWQLAAAQSWSSTDIKVMYNSNTLTKWLPGYQECCKEVSCVVKDIFQEVSSAVKICLKPPQVKPTADAQTEPVLHIGKVYSAIAVFSRRRRVVYK